MRLIYWVSWVNGFLEPPNRPGVCVQGEVMPETRHGQNKQRQEGCPDSQITRFSMSIRTQKREVVSAGTIHKTRAVRESETTSDDLTCEGPVGAVSKGLGSRGPGAAGRERERELATTLGSSQMCHVMGIIRYVCSRLSKEKVAARSQGEAH